MKSVMKFHDLEDSLRGSQNRADIFVFCVSTTYLLGL